jgi:O-Antigen ligase
VSRPEHASAGSLIPALSPALARDWVLLAGPNERSMRQRIAWVWGLLFFNTMTYAAGPTNLIPLPHQFGKALPELALGVGLFLVLTANKKLLVRPNVLLILITTICLLAAIMSFRGYFGLGSMVRWFRFALFVGALWLTTPWWGRRDFMILQFHRRVLMAVIATVLVGLAVSPTKAFAGATGGRLGGIVWPIQPTQVAHYSAVLVGITVVLWLADASKSRWTGLVIVGAFGVLILTHSRIALVAMLAGIFVGGLSLFLSRKRVRRALVVAIVVAGIGALSFAPLVTGWFARGENTQALTNLTGRTNVWSALLSQPRTDANTLLGYGLSNDGFDGIPIDSSWLATYQDQGLVGDVLDGLVLITLLIVALISPRGPGRAVALFLIVYCSVESFTQTGLGQPSADMLDLCVAMSLLMPPLLSTARSEKPRALKSVV